MDPNDFEELLKIQRMMASKLAQENKMELDVKLLDLLMELTKNGKKKIQTELLIIEAQTIGMTEQEVLRGLKQLEQDRVVISPEQGYINLK